MSNYTDTRQSLNETESTAQSMIESYAEKSQQYVREYPVASTMVALGAGAAFGLLIASAIGRGAEARQQSYFANLGNNIASSLGRVVPDSMGWNR